MTVQLLHGDCRDLLRTLPDESVHCCITSPPYWGLRSYLPADHPDKHREIGSEPTLQAWVDTMVEVFREVRRVLRSDGTLWLNLGDAYAGDRGPAWGPSPSLSTQRAMTASARRDDHPVPRSDMRVAGLKPKDLMGQPWRVAFALQADGWWLRQEVIWAKPNPMPESTRDRCTKAHEHVFLLSKSERYFYGFDAMQEPATGGMPGNHTHKHTTKLEGGDEKFRTKGGLVAYAQRQRRKTDSTNDSAVPGAGPHNGLHREGSEREPETRNPRSVWTIPTHPFKGAHFATFPPALADRCMTAGCPAGGTTLDPFGGSGTVGLVADRQHKSAILIDLDARNIPMAQDRIRGESPLFAEVV